MLIQFSASPSLHLHSRKQYLLSRKPITGGNRCGHLHASNVPMIGAALLCPLPIASFIASIRIISQCMHTFNLANGKAVLQHTFLNDILFLFFILVMKSLSIFQLTRLSNKCTSSRDRSFLRAKASHYQKLKSNLSQWCSAQTMHSSHNSFFTNRWAWVKMTIVSMQSNSSYESTNTWIFYKMLLLLQK